MEIKENSKIDVQNKKGFTLVELLAVIAIIAVLMIVAIPAVTNTIASSKKSTYATNAKKFIDAVRLGLTNGDLKKDGTGTCQFPDPGEYIVVDLSTVYVEKGGEKSSFNQDYDKHYVIVANEGTSSGDKIVYYYAGSDKGKNGIENFTKEDEITKSKIKVGNAKANYTSALSSFNGYKKENECYGNKDESYTPSDDNNTPQSVSNFVRAYIYSESGANKCISGNEATCQTTSCYIRSEGKDCPPGTIIDYQVKKDKVERFHVINTTQSYLIMQSQKNIVYDTAWYNSECERAVCNPSIGIGMYTSGPKTILQYLREKTNDWSNTNDQNYSLGIQTENQSANETGCENVKNCSINAYSMSQHAYARLITLQEVNSVGCGEIDHSCPIWMYNYLSNSKANGGTENYTGSCRNSGDCETSGYWTSSVYPSSSESSIWGVDQTGKVMQKFNGARNFYGARAVVRVTRD